MSSAALAKKRRANVSTPPQTVNVSQQEQPAGKNTYSLPQILGIFEKRLINVEIAIKESKQEKPEPAQEPVFENTPLKDILEEYNSRFDLLAFEINNLKDIILKLQSFTMEVNKTLLDERVQYLSKLGDASSSEDTVEMYIRKDDTNAENVDSGAIVFSEP